MASYHQRVRALATELVGDKTHAHEGDPPLTDDEVRAAGCLPMSYCTYRRSYPNVGCFDLSEERLVEWEFRTSFDDGWLSDITQQDPSLTISIEVPLTCQTQPLRVELESTHPNNINFGTLIQRLVEVPDSEMNHE